MRHSDSLVMAGPYAHLSTPVLRALVEKAEAAQSPDALVIDHGTHLAGFSTALTDEERQYLDLCAELFARDEDAAGRQPCGEQPREVPT
jgi:hypothetical protein